MSQTFSSSRRWAVVGVLVVAAGASAMSVAARRDRSARVTRQASFNVCAPLQGDAARACLKREVGRELAAVGGGPKVTFAAPASAARVTFAESPADEEQPLVCPLHLRVGVTSADGVSWVRWHEPLAESVPR